jgi:predicted GH43/DUF377 family glycosyl hydrolase
MFCVSGCAQISSAGAKLSANTSPPRIDVSKAPAPLFDDPLWHGATDPFVVWNPSQKLWFMYYTQRRATMPNPNRVDWVHGSNIAIASSPDGINWSYLGIAKGDNDLTEPLKVKGLGPEPGITWWAPGLLWHNNQMHMWVTRVDGVYTSWVGKRNILHFVSDDGINFKYSSTATLSSERVIDATVYRAGEKWYMVYKDEAAGSRTTRSESTDLENWTNAKVVSPDGSQEAPFPFRWKNQWWMMVDGLGNRGLRLYKSEDGIEGWQYVTTILAGRDGTRTKDDNVGHHPGIIIQGDGANEQCLVYYFTHQGNQTVMQLAEMEMGADGVPVCDRNKYAAK